jgi:hypothetical protein
VRVRRWRIMAARLRPKQDPDADRHGDAAWISSTRTSSFTNVQNPDGTTTEWSGWLTAPNKLQRAGWTKNTLKPGDKVTLVGNQQKNGSPVLQIRKVTGPEGDLPTFEQ